MNEDYVRAEQGRFDEAYSELHGLAQEFETPFDAPAVLVVGHQTDGKSATPSWRSSWDSSSTTSAAAAAAPQPAAPITLRMKYDPNCELPLWSLISESDTSSARLMSLQEIQAYF